MYALWFRRYMDEFGATNEDFGRYTVVARRHAATNPNAWFYERPITLDDHQASRWIVEPVLRLLDCCQESDGGVALVVTRADRAPRPPATGGTHRGGGRRASRQRRRDVQLLPRRSRGVPRGGVPRPPALGAIGARPADIDVAMLYENFSPLVFLVLEAFGFCERGEAKDFIADGNLDIDGALPVNTHGGLLGEAYIHGINNILEGVRQVRGTAANQVTRRRPRAGRSGTERPRARPRIERRKRIGVSPIRLSDP